MKRSTELPARVSAFADRHGMLPPGSTVLCALSGGGDSMALLGVLLDLSQERDLTVLAAHYNHGLRGQESDADESFVRDWCDKYGIPLTTGRGDVGSASQKTGRGIEETARALRYAFLDGVLTSTNADCIATAHHADDNAETLLLHLARGTGLDGLAGIPPVRGRVIRPLLGTTRQEIQDYLDANRIPYRTDSTNADPAYARNRIRRDVMPVFRDLNPAFSPRLAANLAHIQADRAFLEDLAAQSLQADRQPDGTLTLPAGKLAALPRPLAVRVVKQTLAALGRHQVTAVHLDQVLDLASSPHPSAWVPLPEGLTVRREYHRLVFGFQADQAAPPGPVILTDLGDCPGFGTWNVTVTSTICPETDAQTPFSWHLAPHQIALPLTLRSRKTGDALRLPGRREKPLKKWYIDEKIPRHLRDGLPVLADHRGVIAAAGLGPDAGRTAAPGEAALRFTLTQKERT